MTEFGTSGTHTDQMDPVDVEAIIDEDTGEVLSHGAYGVAGRLEEEDLSLLLTIGDKAASDAIDSMKKYRDKYAIELGRDGVYELNIRIEELKKARLGLAGAIKG